ncbi:FAD-binding oxidoreductase [Bradyrhizobium sp. WSM1253]|uniref:FAD-binding oxidoreductase n=1 Tax=Bradyrhizobium sp. WSM1253 TaxID=319003 RepID=UPI001FDA82CC|nr:FAD-binding oxidoreductase [Bradyrhizobium sp. WSM1253]
MAETPRISRGSGLSYAAASFLQGGLSVSHRSFDRVTDFDSARHVVEVETGISLFALHRFLSARGLYLPIQPGHGRISVGGCIAADVHGKNQSRDGTFINQVELITLLHPAHGMLELSPQKDPDLFRLTCGGYGLTGHIIRARLRASTAPTAWVQMLAVPFADAAEGFDRLRLATRDADFAYTWHDMASSKPGFGSGYIFEGRFVDEGASTASDAEPPMLSSKNRGRWPVPLMNAFSARALNLEFRRRQKQLLQGQVVSLQDALFPAHKTQLYFQLFGAKGFREYQAILPDDAIEDYVESVRTCVRAQPLPITLSSAKAFVGTRELLRFTGAGVCLALNMSAGAAADQFMAFLDERVMALGGLPNIIKDSRLPRAVIDTCYGGADRFRDTLHAFDPKRLFRSDLSERLGL